MEYKEIIDAAVSKDRFSIMDCIAFEPYLEGATFDELTSIKCRITAAQYKNFKKGLVRNAFLIEPVNDIVTSTKVETHWSSRLQDDIRYSEFETCMRILVKLIHKVANLSAEDFDLLKEFFANTVIPYEMPIDYKNRYADPIHTVENVDLFLDSDTRKCIATRRLIRDKRKNPASDVFSAILDDKIKVKTYLTDRAQTGAYKTNREKRWEALPGSPQYALRRDCMKIETKLLLQVVMFEGADDILVANMKSEQLIPDHYEYCKCPITGDNIPYCIFADDVLHPTHGKSKFQVGHLNPLKAQGLSGAAGHTVDNISWISEDGNRIQGSLSMAEVETLLKRIYSNRPELRER